MNSCNWLWAQEQPQNAVQQHSLKSSPKNEQISVDCGLRAAPNAVQQHSPKSSLKSSPKDEQFSVVCMQSIFKAIEGHRLFNYLRILKTSRMKSIKKKNKILKHQKSLAQKKLKKKMNKNSLAFGDALWSQMIIHLF